MLGGGWIQSTGNPGPKFRAAWHSSAKRACNLKRTGAPRRIQSCVPQPHSQRRYH
ncbi:unnamed protein product [Schistosoma margrebowiei]|uniref:Uncharacterized protein n=1 Tax=Schistosoma margrebowiei TaxID=48269 RepID=A0A183LNW3_9TREM|nr:unnamed protein product [Schistosoma margrebowiei]